LEFVKIGEIRVALNSAFFFRPGLFFSHQDLAWIRKTK